MQAKNQYEALFFISQPWSGVVAEVSADIQADVICLVHIDIIGPMDLSK